MKYRHSLVVAPFLASLATTCLGQQHQQSVGSLASSAKAADAPFLVKPYLQLGDAPPGRVGGDLALLWHAEDAEGGWSVEFQPGAVAAWQSATAVTSRRIAVPGIAPHRVFAPS